MKIKTLKLKRQDLLVSPYYRIVRQQRPLVCCSILEKLVGRNLPENIVFEYSLGEFDGCCKIRLVPGHNISYVYCRLDDEFELRYLYSMAQNLIQELLEEEGMICLASTQEFLLYFRVL